MDRKRLGHFEIVGQIGAGGMGEVWRAHDPKTGRDVALKLLPANLANDRERLARFEREARTLASLNHPNIAGLFGVEEEDGQPFLIMELVEGEELGELVARSDLSVEEILNLTRQLAEGLEEAHEKGIVHRDLKPANIMVTPDGKLKILDFGLARALSGDEVGEGDISHSPTITSSMTQAGTLLGTAAYMSPEQARGKPVDRRADNWSFGVVLFEMLSGTRLFAGETIGDTLANVLKGEIPIDDLGDKVPHAVKQLLERCLERDPRKRLRDIGEARVRLERWRDDPSSLDASFGSVELAPERSGWRGWLPWVLLAIAVATAGAAWLRPTAGPTSARDYRVALRLDDEEFALNLSGNISLSPDGKMLSYLGPDGIRVVRLDREEELLLPNTEGGQLAEFSPDGEWVAFVSSGRLRRTRISGGSPLDICPVADSRGLAWINSEIIVMTGQINSGLVKVSLIDGRQSILTELDRESDERSHRWPTATPDGKGVVFGCQFLGKDYDQGDLRYISLEGGEQLTIFRGGSSPEFGPRGQLLFARGKALYAIGWQPGDGEFGGLPEPVLDQIQASVGDQEADDGYAFFDISNDGVMVYLTESGRDRDEILTILDLETKEEYRLGSAANYESPRFSPDGSMLAANIVDRYGQTGIQVFHLDTGDRIQFSEGENRHFVGCWSPNSRWLYWTASAFDGRWQLYRRAADSRTPPERIGSGEAEFQSLSITSISDNLRWGYGMVWTGADYWDVIRIDLEDPGLASETILGGSSNNFEPKLSPDGKWLIYGGGTSTGTFDLQIRSLPDTGASWELLKGFSWAHTIRWASDLSAIYVHGEQGFQRIDMEFAAGRPRRAKITTLHQAPMALSMDASTGDITPDGRLGVYLRPAFDEPDVDTGKFILISDFGTLLDEKLGTARN